MAAPRLTGSRSKGTAVQDIYISIREYVDDFLSVADRLLYALGITKLPHFTTLEKFMLRVPSTLSEKVLGSFIYLTKIRGQVFAPDSSGFSLHHASPYYALRIKRDALSSMRKQVRLKERKEMRKG